MKLSLRVVLFFEKNANENKQPSQEKRPPFGQKDIRFVEPVNVSDLALHFCENMSSKDVYLARAGVFFLAGTGVGIWACSN